MSHSACPRVSVVMANHNGAAHIAAAVRSVLAQTEASLELILCDDGSDDDSLARAEAAARGDLRLVMLRSERRGGPAAARNRGLQAARGRWIAVVDNDDFIHPERLERLLDAAERDGADIAADDLVIFYDDGARPPHAHLGGALAERPNWIEARCYERTNRLLGEGPALGYLKPAFRRALGARYDETLRIGEDSDLVLRLTMAGAKLRLYPDLGYFYRKHARSISHRLDRAAIEALDAAYARLDPGADRALARELRAGARARADARAFTELIDALKTRDLARAVKTALRRPRVLPLLKEPIFARLRPWRTMPALTGRRITLLSRQRIVGATNGSSAYVLALAGALKQAGYAVDYLGASPKIFGRWAVLRLRPETAAFDRYLVHGGVRLGRFVLARDPRVWAASALALADAALARLGLRLRLSRPAEYAQGAPATRADKLFIARHADPRAEAVLCDYAYLTPLAPYALAPQARRLVIMHDLISARVADPAAEAATEKVAALSREDELRLLGMADAAIAIQADEAESVRAALPHLDVIVAPYGVGVARAPQPGRDDLLLFVGSNTAPNIVGLNRFFRESWPRLRAARPNAQLYVAGSVSRAIEAAPEGVKLLGVVADLAPLYAEAGVVISPLYTGSGLKIKLVEALAAGKAVVGTSITAQGVTSIVADAMVCADDSSAFADAVAALAGDAARRARLGAAALACAEAHFSARAAFAPLVSHIAGHGAAPPQKRLPAAAAASQ